MRLINVEPLAMEEFYRNIPRYAILSHRWEEEEVTFKDYKFPNLSAARQMKAFRKILFCAEQARKDEVGYFWIDTCCTDKSSSAELSEAINSMYTWYRDSLYCYVCMVDDSGLEGKLLTATGISKATLRDFSATSRDYSVALKMSWAAARQTTRNEDTAYCLMGIFDINMPLLYGEGTKSIYEITGRDHEKKAYDHSIFCWENPSSGPSSYRGLLARSPAEFKGSPSVRPWRRSYGHSLELEEIGLTSKTYEMTNRGLRINLPMHEIGGGEYLARLECIFDEHME
ncbi:heterokaryon incompatibility protein-domain-containing protein [Podospora didyma]|uniref:Heterokaryon incompatibility protein-domain-containing protein n=1 Tax=Podospora didyma TaxID=330526 RepID=A0AAE0N9Q1_9PEZI|nr:heterokaryon incompatibility protein-domain-containing protein [Podospora didyma]